MKWNVWPLIRKDLYSIEGEDWHTVLQMLDNPSPNANPKCPWRECPETIRAMEELYKSHKAWTREQQRSVETLMHYIQNSSMLDNHFANTVQNCSGPVIEWALQFNCKPDEYLLQYRGIAYYLIRMRRREGYSCRTLHQFGNHDNDPIDEYFIATTQDNEWEPLLRDMVHKKLFQKGLALSEKGRSIIREHFNVQELDVENIHDFKCYNGAYGPMQWMPIYLFEQANRMNYEADRYIQEVHASITEENKENFYKACFMCKEIMRNMGVMPLTCLNELAIPQDKLWMSKVLGIIELLNPSDEQGALAAVQYVLNMENQEKVVIPTLEL